MPRDVVLFEVRPFDLRIISQVVPWKRREVYNNGAI